MSRRRIIALTAGAVAVIVVFAAVMSYLFFAVYGAEKDRIIFISVALGPVLMISVMVGYAVWWGVLFILTLVLPEESPKDQESESRS
jgi:hypothetical protein